MMHTPAFSFVISGFKLWTTACVLTSIMSTVDSAGLGTTSSFPSSTRQALQNPALAALRLAEKNHECKMLQYYTLHFKEKQKYIHRYSNRSKGQCPHSQTKLFANSVKQDLICWKCITYYDTGI